MVLTIIFLIAWEGVKTYWWIVLWIARAWVTVAWTIHCWYVKGMAYVLDRTSSPQSPSPIRSPNGQKRRAIEMDEQSSESSREQTASTALALDYGRLREATVPEGYVCSSFKLAAFSACFEAVENLRRRDALIGVHDEELIQMLCAIIRGGRELYTVRIPWPVLEGIEGGGRSNGVNGINGCVKPTTRTGSTDWETIYSKYRMKSASGEGASSSDASKPRAKSPEYVDNLNKIHNSLASLHAIVEKTNAEKEELKKLQCSGSSESVSPRETEKEGKKDGEKSQREKKEERERFEKKKVERREDVPSKKVESIDELFDDKSEDDERAAPASKRRKEETRDEKKKRKDEERRKKKGGEDEYMSSDEDENEKKEREKEKRREEREREKRQAIMSISGCYSVKSNEQEERERERQRVKEKERERARKEAKEEEERNRQTHTVLERDRRRMEEEEKRKKDEDKEREEKSISSPSVMPVRKNNKKCTCSLPFPDLSELNEKQGSSYRTLEDCGTNWNELKVHTIVATLRNGRWVRARVNETRTDGLYLGLESSGGGGFSGRVKEGTGCIHINKIVAIEKK